MENSKNTQPSRSRIRRLTAPIGLAVAVLGGGAWGVYQFTTGAALESSTRPGETAHSASTAKDELKNLFASDTKNVGATRPLLATKTDRYALEASPPTSKAAIDRYTPASTQSASLESAPTESVDPFATPPAPPTEATRQDTGRNLATEQAEASPKPLDRYAKYDPAPPALAPDEPTPAAALVDTIQDETDTSKDVTRGQEPGINPLREVAAAASNRQDDLDAQAAFGSGPAATTLLAADPAGDQMAAALSKARPLGQNSPAASRKNQPAIADGRYSVNPPLGVGPPAAGVESGQAGLVSPPPTPLSASEGSGGLANITPTPGLANSPGTGRPGERLLEGMQSPSITIQKLAPEEIQVGKRCTFAIRVQNTGQRTAQNVQIHDEIPLGTELVGTAPRALVSGSDVVWDLGMLSVGEERTVEMELIPVEEGELGSVATVLVAALASAKSRCTRPELALRLSSSKPQVLLGEQQLVQIEISNPGSGDATGVMLLESVPEGVSHESGPALEFDIGTLRAGESRRLELVLSAEKAGRIHNVMTARTDASLQVEARCEFEVIAPQLQLSIEGPQKRYLERPATYRVSVDNPGTATAHDVELVTQLPRGLQFVSANNMGEYDSASHAVEWYLIELPANERGTVELVALPIEPGAQTLQVATTARHGLEDHAEKEVQVEGLAALMFEVADLADPIEIGGETTYEIRVVNQGSKAAENVQVVAIVPPGLRALSGQGETRHTIQGERFSFAPIPSLGPKAETTFRIQVQGTRAGDQRMRVQLTTDDIQQPITKEESTRVYADE